MHKTRFTNSCRCFNESVCLCGRVAAVRGHRLGPADDELYQRTTVSVMQKEAEAGTIIYSYSPQGFNISGNRVLGPCAVVPPAILQWNVSADRSSKLAPHARRALTLCFCYRWADTRTSRRRACPCSICWSRASVSKSFLLVCTSATC